MPHLSDPPYILPRATAEALVGRRLPAELFDWPLLGHRILVALEPPKTRFGSIIVPVQSQKLPARGHVISAGELVGTPWHPASGECTAYWPLRSAIETEHGIRIVPDPSTILGARVLFSAYAGDALLLDPDDEGDPNQSWVEKMKEMGMDSLEWWRSPFKTMTDNDIISYHLPSLPAPLTRTTGRATVSGDEISDAAPRHRYGAA